MLRHGETSLTPISESSSAVSASIMSASQRNNLRYRRACSRCHAHKLKCPDRSPGEESCARCMKAGALCVFGLSMRGLPQSLLTETGLKTAKEMDLDIMARQRTKRPRLSHLDPIVSTRPNSELTNNVEEPPASLDTAFSLESHFEFDDLVNSWQPTSEPRLSPSGSEAANAQHASFPTFQFPKLNLTGPIMDYFDPHRDGLELSVPPQSRQSSRSSIGNVSDWEIMPQQISSDFSLDHHSASETWSPHTSIDDNLERLTKLTLGLHQNAASLAQVVVNYPANNPQHNRTSHGHSEKFAVDDTFRLTQTMMDIIQGLYKSESVEESNDRRPLGNMASDARQDVPGRIVGDMAIVEPNTERQIRRIVDQPTFHLVISCWLRLGSIYYTIFGHIKTCIEERVGPATRDGRSILLPSVEIGKFQLPFTTAITLQMFASLSMASQLLQCMLSLVDEIEASQALAQERSVSQIEHDYSVGKQSDVVEAICKEVRSRANILYQKLHFTRGILLRSGLV